MIFQLQSATGFKKLQNKFLIKANGRTTSALLRTLDRGVGSLVKSYLKNPKTHSLQNDRASVSTIDQHVLVIHPGDKDLITDQIAACNGKTILFVKIQHGADRLADNLAKDGVPVGALYGRKSQAVRTRTLKLFKEQENVALVATVAASYGIHVGDILLVVHFEGKKVRP